MQGIYRILNLVTNKWYVGSSQNIWERWKDHRKALRCNNDSIYLQAAFNKYGVENFILEILEEVKGSRKDTFNIEQEYLDRGFELGVLYNVSRSACGGSYGEVSDETRVKMSKNNTGENNPFYGKTHTEEWRREQSEKMSGENNPRYGKSPSDKTRAKLSKAGKGRVVTEETRAKLSVALMGHKVTEETRAKLSGENNPMYGKHHTKEWKENQSKASMGNEYGAKPYPAFYNIETNEFVLAGDNLVRLCDEQNLNYMAMWNLKEGLTKRSRDDWRLATEDKIKKNDQEIEILRNLRKD